MVGVANAASLQLIAGTTGGELITLFGVGLGRSGGIVGLPGANGAWPTQLGGIQVLFNSKPAPLLYVGPNQINLQVPFTNPSYLSFQAQVQVVGPNLNLPVLNLGNMPSLGVFSAVLNSDGSVNSAANPAHTGSAVSLFVTGLDQFVSVEGVSSGAIPVPVSGNLTALSYGTNTFGGKPTAILYQGSAPGLIDGVGQINVQLPAGLIDPTIELSETSPQVSANGVKVYAR